MLAARELAHPSATTAAAAINTQKLGSLFRNLANLPDRHSVIASKAPPRAGPIQPEIMFCSTDRPGKACGVDIRDRKPRLRRGC